MEPTLEEISAKLDTLIAAVARLEAKGEPLPRFQYTKKEFAKMAGLSDHALQHRKTWKRYGGIKRGGSVVFPESARIALSKGERLP